MDMRRRVRWILPAAVLLGLVAAAAPAGAGEPDPAAGRRVAGVVVDAAGKALAGRVVQLAVGTRNPWHYVQTADRIERLFEPIRPWPGTRRTRTAADGTFAFAGVAPDLHVEVEVLSVVPDLPARASLEPGAAREGLRLVVRRGRALRGVVVDHAGTGVRAWISGWARSPDVVWGTYAAFGQRPIARQVPTDAEGRFVIAVPTDADTWLDALVPGGVGRGGVRVPPAGEVVIRLGVAGGAVAFGRVLDETGAPVAGARIRLNANVHRHRDQGNRVDILATTDVEGRFRVEHLPEAHLMNYAVTAPGHLALQGMQGGVPLLAGRPWRADFVLRRGRDVVGRFVDAEGRPLTGVEVGGRALTDGKGRFRLGVASPDAHVLAVTAPAHVLVHDEALGPLHGLRVPAGAPGESTDIGDVVLALGRTLAVRVVDERLAPVAGALVRLTGNQSPTSTPGPGVQASAMTAPAGDVVFRGLAPAGWLNLQVSAAGHVRQNTQVAPRADAPVQIVLRRAGRVAGRVVDAHGAPLAGVRVFAAGGSVEAATDEDGRFVLRGVAPGRAVLGLHVGPDRPDAPRCEVVVRAGETTPAALLRLPGTGVVSGRVLAPDGHGAAGVSVWVAGLEGAAAGGSKSLSTEVDGAFRVTHLPAGRYRVTVSASPDGTREVAPGAPPLEFTLPVPARRILEGRVLDPDGAPVAHGTVQAAYEGDGAGSMRGSGRIHGGWFRLAVPAGEQALDLSVLEPKDGRGHDLNVLPGPVLRGVRGEGPVVLRLERAQVIAGHVLAEGGGPVAGLAVFAQPKTPVAPGWRPPLRSFTDAEGAFRIQGLAPGTYTVGIVRHAAWMTPEPAEVEAGTPDLIFHARRWGRVGGRVSGPNGAPLAHARLRLWWPVEGSRGGRALTTKAGADGRFSFAYVPPGRTHTLRVDPPAVPGQELVGILLEEVRSGQEALEVVLPRGLVIGGRVTDADGAPLPGATVRGSDPQKADGGKPLSPWAWSTTTDAEGRYELRGLPHDVQVRLEFVGPKDAVPAWFPEQRAKVPAGAPDVNVRLTRGLAIRGTVEGVPVEVLRGLRLTALPAVKGDGATSAKFVFDGTTRAFVLQPLRAGDYKLRSYARGNRRLAVPRDVEARAPADDVRLEAHELHVLAGRLVGTDVRGFRVEFHQDGAKTRRLEIARADGGFEFPGVPSAPGTLFAYREGSPFVALARDVRSAAGRAELTLARGHVISGRIENLPGKMSRGRVIAVRGTLRRSGEVAEDGWFTTPPLPPGLWRLEFTAHRPRRGGYAVPGEIETGSEHVLVRYVPDRR